MGKQSAWSNRAKFLDNNMSNNNPQRTVDVLPHLRGAAKDPIGDRPRTKRKRRTNGKPKVFVPGGRHRVTDTAEQLGKLLADTGDYYCRGGTVVKKGADDNGELMLRTVKAASLPSTFESVAKIVMADEKGKPMPATFGSSSAELVLKSDAFVDCLPRIIVISACPILVESSGELSVVTGYDRESGVLASGDMPSDLDLDEARELLCEIVAEFRFATESDRSRALAAIISPALLMGNLLGGRAPVDLGEANSSQSGKGYRNKLTAAVYRAPLVSITQRSRGGVGSMEESFNKALVDGRAFISIDNIRGKIDSPAIESFMTEDVYMTRSPYIPPTEICPHRVVLMLTSNRAEATEDLSKRSSIVSILKQPDTYEYAKFPEGDLIDHVRANQPGYLGAVFAVVQAWHRAGKPTTNTKGHDFRRWAGVMDWIVQNLLQAAPLLDGHREAQDRVSNPHLGWLREVALAVIRADRTGEWLKTSAIMEIMDMAGVEIPGVQEGNSIEDDTTHKIARQQLGRRLSMCFQVAGPQPTGAASNNVCINIDGYAIERESQADDFGNNLRIYRFSANDRPPSSNGSSDGSSNKTPH